MTKRLQWLVFLAALCALVAIYFFTQYQIDRYANRPLPVREVPEIRPEVSVKTVTPGRYQSRISAFGSTEAHYSINLSAQVAGQVEQISPQFESGFRLKKDQEMLRLENSDYRAAVAAAKQQVAEARLLYLQEERQGLQAQAEWLASGLEGDPDSDLVLRVPQLASAEASLANAEALLASAEKDLQQSLIRAPFDALVITRDVSPGSYLQTGTQVASLYSTDRVEVKVSLSDREWQSLPEPEMLKTGEWPVDLHAVEGDASWQGKVLRVEQHLDGTTRQRSLIVGVENPLDQQPVLYPGVFVEVSLGGRQMDELWQVPTSSLSQRGEIWYVTADMELAKFATSPVFSDERSIYINPPENLKATANQILLQPISSYIEGMAVAPIEAVDYE
ncbi:MULTISPECIES: efflux RND transporter periplasmic adaptor subunit [unclassified Methylophaga]|jgi:RND family efflux transporter MFP subunit|uniref:efflux RND transporter periplasmic adaptor subunit n=1 Tax=unclassified Methylophaga TaxID=2629249 RepID=UPI000C93CC63|nr:MULTISPECIES: efflux RND transporter periplasmic adaptor subunit [unclassified Methylophaga]MAK67210.1 efflux transporter periplasmic adaptor subunit [Methylophaga sp.]MAY18248.1 efflux transporter periplasmic adaptor subunit [Methylophaga sp.]MBN47565.1 efflux transporter periplasmic adaptor subunit [Methylophaga sp.]HCD04670.1 efflux transporter periplasmic adaptor subunit [Methylophaga sp.]|tara:strand:+ start:6693 stop:7862 length:1170 start_codon:yes stop_codon:yes gene_type:complete